MTDALQEYRRKVQDGEMDRPEALNPREKALANPMSLRAAINAKCWDCVCFQRREVTLCVCDDCPLFHVRPWQKKL